MTMLSKIIINILIIVTSNVVFAGTGSCINALKIVSVNIPINIMLIGAIVSQDLETAQRIIHLDKGKEINPQFTDNRGLTALMYAARRDYAGIVLQLIGRGAQPNTKDHSGMTALMYAAMNDNLITVRILLRAGADPEITEKSNLNALRLARIFDAKSVTRYLNLYKKHFKKSLDHEHHFN